MDIYYIKYILITYTLCLMQYLPYTSKVYKDIYELTLSTILKIR